MGDDTASKTAAWLKSHQVRLSFEQVACMLFVAIIVIACLVGFWSNDMAKRVVELKESIKDFLGMLALLVGGSWTRGGVDHGIQALGGQK